MAKTASVNSNRSLIIMSIVIFFLVSHDLSQQAYGAFVSSSVKIAEGTNGGPATLALADFLGASVAELGDINDDGVKDIVMGAWGDDTGGGSGAQGAVYVTTLDTDGTVKTVAEGGLGPVKLADSTGGAPNLADADNFGFSVAGLGDLNGGGVEDIVVGSRGDDTGASGAGAVYVLFLTTSGTVSSSVKIASSTNGGPALLAGDAFGISVTEIGDLNGDSIRDIAVGATGDDTGGSATGAVYILYMNTAGTVKSSPAIVTLEDSTNGTPNLTSGDGFGSGIAKIGDLNNDGTNDIAVGAQTEDTGGTSQGAVFNLFLDPSPSFSSASLNRQTGVLTITFSETIDNTPSTNIDLTKLFISETGSADQIALTGATITTVGDSTTISITLTSAQLTSVLALTTPQLDISAAAVMDTTANTISADPDKTLTLTGSAGGSGSSTSSSTSSTNNDAGSGPKNLNVERRVRSESYDPDGFGSGNSLVTHQISYDKVQKRLQFIISSTAPHIQVYVQGGTQRYTATMEQNQPFLSEKKLVFSAPLPDSENIGILVKDLRDHETYRIKLDEDRATFYYHDPGYDRYIAKLKQKDAESTAESTTEETSFDKEDMVKKKLLTNVKHLNVSEQQKKIYQAMIDRYGQ